SRGGGLDGAHRDGLGRTADSSRPSFLDLGSLDLGLLDDGLFDLGAIDGLVSARLGDLACSATARIRLGVARGGNTQPLLRVVVEVAGLTGRARPTPISWGEFRGGGEGGSARVWPVITDAVHRSFVGGRRRRLGLVLARLREAALRPAPARQCRLGTAACLLSGGSVGVGGGAARGRVPVGASEGLDLRVCCFG